MITTSDPMSISGCGPTILLNPFPLMLNTPNPLIINMAYSLLGEGSTTHIGLAAAVRQERFRWQLRGQLPKQGVQLGPRELPGADLAQGSHEGESLRRGEPTERLIRPTGI